MMKINEDIVVRNMIILLIEKGNLDLALKVFYFFKPSSEKIVEKLIAAMIEGNTFCIEEILDLKGQVGQSLTQDEAEKILLPYFNEENASRFSKCKKIPLDVIRAASKETARKIFEMVLSVKSGCDDRFKEEVYYIFKSK